jgi:hypothetical protein
MKIPTKTEVRKTLNRAWRLLSDFDQRFPLLERSNERGVLYEAQGALSDAIAKMDALIMAEDDARYAEEKGRHQRS